MEATAEQGLDQAIASLISPEITGEEAPVEAPEEELEDEEYEEEESEESEESEEYSDEDDEDTEDEEESGPELHTVKIDGTEVQVTYDELKRGYSGQAYVQQGMQQVAQARKALEANAHSLQAERQQLDQAVQLIQNGLVMPQPPKATDYENDSYGLMQARIQYETQKEEFDGKMAVVQNQLQQMHIQQQQQQAQFVQSEYQKLVSLDPDFGDQTKAESIRETLVKGGQELYGIDPQELGTIMDHRAFRVLKDAIAYHAIKDGRKSANSKQKAKRRTVRGGAKKSDRAPSKRAEQARREKLKKTGSTKDAAALLLDPNLRK